MRPWSTRSSGRSTPRSGCRRRAHAPPDSARSASGGSQRSPPVAATDGATRNQEDALPGRSGVAIRGARGTPGQTTKRALGTIEKPTSVPASRPTQYTCFIDAWVRRAHSGETDHPFRWQTDHPFRRKPITCSGANRSPVPTQTDHLSERSDAGRNHESRFSVRVDGRLRFRIESPFRSSLYALCTRRSRIALASVGSPMTSCHLRLSPISRTG